MLTDAVEVRENSDIEGSGLFAIRPIPAGELIFQFDDSKPPVHLYELVNWQRKKRAEFFNFANQIGRDEWSFRQGNIKFMNHSCDPNAWWNSYGTLTARSDIKQGDEVTYDYSTTDITLTYSMQCRCGSTSCRGVVTNKDYLDRDFQETYAGHLPEHVAEAIKETSGAHLGSQANQVDRFPEHIVAAIKQAKLRESEFREKYGDQYVFEMVKQLILKK
jgi:hypothetical protein